MEVTMADRDPGSGKIVNEADRMPFDAEPAAGFRTPTFDMGFEPAVPDDRALTLAAELEDEELTVAWRSTS
jgi:hypothetical protein